MDVKEVCGNCNFCIRDDGFPYCVCKDLYTGVELDQECDETDFYGNKMFAKLNNNKDSE